MSKDLNMLIKEAIEEEINNTNFSPPDKVWEEMKIKIRKQQRQDLLKRLKPVIAAGVIIGMISLMLTYFETPVKAFSFKWINTIQKFVGDTLKIDKKVNPTKRAENLGDPRLDEAQKKVSFDIKVPSYIPNGFKLNNVDVINKSIQNELVKLQYLREKEELKECIEISQESLVESTNITINVATDENTKVKNINIDGVEYTLINYGKNFNKLLWDIGKISYKINGNVNEKDIIKIATSIK